MHFGADVCGSRGDDPLEPSKHVPHWSREKLERLKGQLAGEDQVVPRTMRCFPLCLEDLPKLNGHEIRTDRTDIIIVSLTEHLLPEARSGGRRK